MTNLSPRTLAGSFSDWLAEKLSRVTSSGDLIPEIDGLRFIAIITVILHHSMSILLPASGRSGYVNSQTDWTAAGDRFSSIVSLAYTGHFGVNLFFAISGFILALPFAARLLQDRPAPDLKNYFLRRVTRIEPPYVICITLFFLYLTFVKGRGAELLPHFFASLFYANGLVYGTHNPINSVTWSLEIEIQFYLLVPLMVSIFRLRNQLLRRVLLLSLIAFGGWFSQHVVYPSGYTRAMLSLANFFHFFLVGFFLADLYLSKWLQRKKSILFDGLTVLGAAGIFAVLTEFGQYYNTLALLVLVMYVGFFRGWLSNKLVRLRWIVITGGMCYTFYLYHVPIISELSWNINKLFAVSRPLVVDYLLQCAIVFPIVFILCSLWFVLTEKPFMRWSLSPKEGTRKLGQEAESRRQEAAAGGSRERLEMQ